MIVRKPSDQHGLTPRLDSEPYALQNVNKQANPPNSPKFGFLALVHSVPFGLERLPTSEQTVVKGQGLTQFPCMEVSGKEQATP